MSIIKDIRNTTARFQTFVANRLSESHKGPDMENWNYVNTKINLADLASRAGAIDITIAIPGGDLCSNYRAEAQALLTATETVTQLETRPKKVVLLTDSLSVLQSLASGKPEDYTLHNLVQGLNSLTSRTTAVLKWIPTHTGIHGNEVADQLAKEGSKKL